MSPADPNKLTDSAVEAENQLADPTSASTTTLPVHGGSSRRWILKQTFAALQYPNYRLWFIGQLASLVGTWMQSTAQGYLIFQLTQSPAYLGYVGFAAGVPSWLLMLYGGVVSDRVSRRKLLIITQSLMMVLAFILAALAFLGIVQPWHIILLALGLGIVNAFDAPARQSFVLEMVDREDLGNAIALNSAMFNSATAVGPAIAGLAYAALGPAWCFTLNGLSFIAVILALTAMRLPAFKPQIRRTSAVTELKEGMKYVVSHPVIRVIILTIAIYSLFGMAYATLIPAWAVDILGGNATTNGLLQSARGIGSLVGALMIASMGRFKFKGKLLTLGTFVFPALLLGFAGIRSTPLSLLALVGVGWGSMIMFNMANTLVQTHVPDELRGRVMGLYSLTFFGSAPISALVAGSLADRIGSPETVVITALISLAFAIGLFTFVPRLRNLQ